ncbi:MAG: hypothetical protein KGI60_00020 [Patescibacteria group bacterium]|nr:hypothetical protein [Patescibacteria group bacterium]
MQDADFKEWLMWHAGGGAVLLIVLGVIILWVGSDIASRVTQIQAQRQQLENRLAALDSLVALRSGEEQAAAMLPQLQAALPSKDQLINFSQFLQSLAAADKLTLGFSFGAETASTAQMPGSASFTATLSGSYANFLKFLSAAETGPYYIDTHSIDVTSENGKTGIIVHGSVYSQ